MEKKKLKNEKVKSGLMKLSLIKSDSMLHRTFDLSEEQNVLPIVTICLISDKLKCPNGFTPILKTYDDGSDADLWKDSFGFGLFNRIERYIGISRKISDTHCLEVITDLAIISEKEAIPSNFVCIDFTTDTKERGLKKKYLCARFTPRNDTLDAISDIIILGKSKKSPKGYTLAGEVDGMLICYKVSIIPESYGTNSLATKTEDLKNKITSGPIYPNILSYHHSANDLNKLSNNINSFTIKAVQTEIIKGIDGVPFQLSPLFSSIQKKENDLPTIPELNISGNYNYNFNLERSIAI